MWLCRASQVPQEALESLLGPGTGCGSRPHWPGGVCWWGTEGRKPSLMLEPGIPAGRGLNTPRRWNSNTQVCSERCHRGRLFRILRIVILTSRIRRERELSPDPGKRTTADVAAGVPASKGGSWDDSGSARGVPWGCLQGLRKDRSLDKHSGKLPRAWGPETAGAQPQGCGGVLPSESRVVWKQCPPFAHPHGHRAGSAAAGPPGQAVTLWDGR